MLTWHQTRNGIAVTGLGHQALLNVPMMAFFASRQCPGTAIRAATEWALQQAKTRQVVISGFHSPLEQSVLQLLLQARSPAVAVLARLLSGARLPAHWTTAITAGHLAVVSAADKSARLTTESALSGGTARENYRHCSRQRCWRIVSAMRSMGKPRTVSNQTHPFVDIKEIYTMQ